MEVYWIGQFDSYDEESKVKIAEKLVDLRLETEGNGHAYRLQVRVKHGGYKGEEYGDYVAGMHFDDEGIYIFVNLFFPSNMYWFKGTELRALVSSEKGLISSKDVIEHGEYWYKNLWGEVHEKYNDFAEILRFLREFFKTNGEHKTVQDDMFQLTVKGKTNHRNGEHSGDTDVVLTYTEGHVHITMHHWRQKYHRVVFSGLIDNVHDLKKVFQQVGLDYILSEDELKEDEV